MAIGFIGGVVGAIAGANASRHAGGGGGGEIRLPKSDYADLKPESGFRFCGLRVISPEWGPRFQRLSTRISLIIDEINLRIRATGRDAGMLAFGLQNPVGTEYIEHIAMRPPYLNDSHNTTITVIFALEACDALHVTRRIRLGTVSTCDLAGFTWPNADHHPWAEEDGELVRSINEWKDMRKTVLLDRSLKWLLDFVSNKGRTGMWRMLKDMSESATWWDDIRESHGYGRGTASENETADKAQTTEP